MIPPPHHIPHDPWPVSQAKETAVEAISLICSAQTTFPAVAVRKLPWSIAARSLKTISVSLVA